MTADFGTFLKDLETRYGGEAMRVRHELYFLLQGRWPAWAFLRGVGALVRDLVLVLSLPRMLPPIEGSEVLIVSLAGPSGWGALRRFESARKLRGKVVVIRHPRIRAASIDVPSVLPASPSIHELWTALSRAGNRRRGRGVRRWLIEVTLLRMRLWEACWSGMRAQTPNSLVCHNDFDMFSSTAVDVWNGTGGQSMCVQHGLPTDEFFPVRAQTCLVWGESSSDAFQEMGTTPERLVIDSLGRAPEPMSLAAPMVAALLSQTHTPIYGIDLRPAFVQVAKALAEGGGQWRVRVLLHPEEVRLGHPYGHVQGIDVKAPPHTDLRPGAGLVFVGFSSTAVLDAALAGHPVLGLSLTPQSSRAAWMVARPPWQAAPEDVLTELARFCSDHKYRKQRAEEQQLWLQKTFSRSPRHPTLTL